MSIGVIDRFNAYRANPDPRMATANTFALVLASDGPIYPLYLYWFVGSGSWPSLIALWIVPLYALIPRLARRHAPAARLVLMGSSIANIVLYTVLFGTAAQFQLFLLPCIALGLFFPHHERLRAWALGGIGLGTYIWLSRAHIAPIHPFTVPHMHAIAVLSRITVGTLTWFLMVLFGGMVHALRNPA